MHNITAYMLQGLFYGLLCMVEHRPYYGTIYGIAAPFRGPALPAGLLKPGSINGRFTADAAMIWPGVLLVKTPDTWTDDMCNIESDLVLGAKHVASKSHDFVPGQLIIVRGAGGADEIGKAGRGVAALFVKHFLT